MIVHVKKTNKNPEKCVITNIFFKILRAMSSYAYPQKKNHIKNKETISAALNLFFIAKRARMNRNNAKSRRKTIAIATPYILFIKGTPYLLFILRFLEKINKAVYAANKKGCMMIGCLAGFIFFASDRESVLNHPALRT